MSGLELAKVVHKRCPNIKIILTSGYVGEDADCCAKPKSSLIRLLCRTRTRPAMPAPIKAAVKFVR